MIFDHRTVLTELERELSMRRHVYKREIAESKLTPGQARHRYGSLLAVYRHLRDKTDRPFTGLFMSDEDLLELFPDVPTITPTRGEGLFDETNR